MYKGTHVYAYVYVQTADEGVEGLVLSPLITESGVVIRTGRTCIHFDLTASTQE